MNKIYIMNTTIIPNKGVYVVDEISLERAKELTSSVNLFKVSAIGHDSTAKIISTLLEKEIPVNRVEVKFGVGDIAVCFKLASRPPEGKILTQEEIEAIGYNWMKIERIS